MQLNFGQRYLWLALALICGTLVVSSILLTYFWHLHPCYLCVFQRFLFLLIMMLAILILLFKTKFTSWLYGGLLILCSLIGIGIASYQVWLQSLPGSEFTCSSSEPNLVEIFVIWMNSWVPVLFEATGNCASTELVILYLSLAGWALVAFSTCLIIAVWGVYLRYQQLRRL
ncbi:hypothetical protein TI04_02490 [Achromatium sp. WMS2]|nr:hypothetical protein TI04_02490 [Achromatium sp. WMS2]